MTKVKKMYIVTIKVKSYDGKRPIVRTICGDTIFCNLQGDMSATWTLKRVRA